MAEKGVEEQVLAMERLPLFHSILIIQLHYACTHASSSIYDPMKSGKRKRPPSFPTGAIILKYITPIDQALAPC